MSIPAPERPDINRRGLQIFGILAGLLALTLLLGGVAQAAASGLRASGPVAQTGEPRTLADTGQQRSVATYLEGRGYTVNAVGFPTDDQDRVIEGYVAVAMDM